MFIEREAGRGVDLGAVPAEVAISVVTVGELWAGVLAATDTATRAIRMRTLADASDLVVVEVDAEVARAWAVLRVALRDAGRTLRTNDSWIAATALALDVPVVTQDSDFDGVPGLRVVRA